MEMITERRQFIPGQSPGRTPGAISKTTRQRTDAIRSKILATNILSLLIDEIIEDIQSGNVRFKEKLDAFKTLAPYSILTAQADEVIEQITEITGREDAEKVAELLTTQLKLVR
ncbi:hypothetical protein KRB99_000017 [Salmonella enterica]|nr:hypothetical protein [Salmonella enterica]